jgi:hypothetical protein
MAERWLNLGELTDLTGWSARTVRRKVAGGDLIMRSRGGRRQNGKPLREYRANLTVPIQGTETNRHGAARGLRGKAKAEDRFKAIAAMVELMEAPKEQRFPFLLPDGQRILTLTQAAKGCARQCGRSETGVWRLYGRFKKFGKEGLFSRSRNDKGFSRFFLKHSKAAAFAAYLRHAWQLPFSAIQDAMLRDYKLLEITEEKVPSCETVRRWLQSASIPLVPLALEGQRVYRGRISSYAKRGLLTGTKGQEEVAA